jgi:histone arginine demethylase JMJD6
MNPLIDYTNHSKVAEVTSPNVATFHAVTGNGNIPLLIKGAMDDWDALHTWDAHYFKENFGSLRVTAHSLKENSDVKTFTVREYMDYIYTCKDEAPYYLRNWQFHLDFPEVRKSYHVPEYFRCLTNELPPEENPKLSWFYIGPARSSSLLHIDVMNTAAWNAVVSGKKLWLFFPPDQDDFLYDGMVNAFYPDFSEHPKYYHASPWVCIQNAGEIVYTPSGWWHAVMNLEPCISITENFINHINYKSVLTYLQRNNMHKELRVLSQLVKEN